MSKNKRLSLFETAILIFTSLLVAVGITASWISQNWFEEVYAVEDGFVEWVTVFALLATCIIASRYLFKLSSQRNWLFFATIFFLALFCFFAAGEEISWGQRIFHIQSSEFFKEKNAQGETNLHNLVVNGKKVNKLIFSQLLTVAAVLFLIVLPWLYKKSQKIKQLINYSGIPVPRIYQIMACIGLFILTTISPSGKKAELLEAGGCLIFMLIVLFPQNKAIFRKVDTSED